MRHLPLAFMHHFSGPDAQGLALAGTLATALLAALAAVCITLFSGCAQATLAAELAAAAAANLITLCPATAACATGDASRGWRVVLHRPRQSRPR